MRLLRAGSLVIGCAALAVSGLAACGDASRAGPIQTHASPVARMDPAPEHIAVIVMENEEYGDVIGRRSAPFINGLAKRYALASRMFGITHPSLPNYLALTGGSTFGISSDCTDCSVGASSIVTQMTAARVSWKAYMQDLPAPCFTGSGAGEYAKRHDPFVYYRSLVADRRLCGHVVPLSELAADEGARTLPRFIWITPNVCNDMHDCSVTTGDRFLSQLVPPLLAELGRNGLLFLTWDEGTTNDGCCRLAAGGRIVTIVAGPGARAHATLKTPVDHYSVLQTIDDLLGLPRLRNAACACTPSLAPLLADP